MSLAKPIPPVPDQWFTKDRYIIEDRGHDTSCWVWQGALCNGYAQANVGSGGARRNIGVHRLYYERERGPVALDLHLDHLCRVRACINPEHLEPVTAAEHVRRTLPHRGLSYRGPGRPRQPRLSPDVIADIRARLASTRALARRHGVSQTMVRNIQSGQTYKQVIA